jgi:hypothetical protein
MMAPGVAMLPMVVPGTATVPIRALEVVCSVTAA